MAAGQTLGALMRKCALGGAIVVSVIAVAGCSGTSDQSGASSSAAAPLVPTPSQAASSAAAGTAEWSYTGANGPENWGVIAPACAATPQSTESPIDIEIDSLAASPVTPFTMSYTPAEFEVENIGYTVEAIPLDTTQNSITLGDTAYYLQQFHFHAQSEHQLNGRHAPLEMHLVHRSDSGELAVLGVLLDSGAPNEPLTDLFDSIPGQENEDEPTALTDAIDLTKVFPADGELAQYQGSLTTPPCTEGVRWNVFLTPVNIADEQLAAYSTVFSNNSRPVQPLNGRAVVKAHSGQ